MSNKEALILENSSFIPESSMEMLWDRFNPIKCTFVVFFFSTFFSGLSAREKRFSNSSTFRPNSSLSLSQTVFLVFALCSFCQCSALSFFHGLAPAPSP